MKQPSDKHETKPKLDEAAFQQLLEAAYVLQEHSGQSVEQVAASRPAPLDPMAEIVETQRLIHMGALDLQSSCGLIAARAHKVARCSSALAGTIAAGEWTFRAAVGEAGNELGSRLSAEKTLAGSLVESLTGSTFQCPDVGKNPKLNTALCTALGVRSFISAIVAHEGKAAGFLELRYEKANAFSQQDVRTAELMAGLLREAIIREAERQWRQSINAERTNMLQVLDAIKPQLDRLAQPPSNSRLAPAENLGKLPGLAAGADLAVEAPKIPPASVGGRRESASQPANGAESDRALAIDIEKLLKDPFAPKTVHPSTLDAASEAMSSEDSAQVEPKSLGELTADEWQPIVGSVCRGCGTPFTQEEFFCGGCGLALFAPETASEEAPARASLWHLHVQSEREAAQAQASNTLSLEGRHNLSASSSRDLAEADLPEALQTLFEQFSTQEKDPELNLALPRDVLIETENPPKSAAPALTHLERSSDVAPPQPLLGEEITSQPAWNSAAETQQWLESLPQSKKAPWLAEQWRTHKANVYLFVSAVLLCAVLAGWGSRPDQTYSHTAAPKAQADDSSKLNWFEKTLVSFGLAEPPPPAPAYAGNPSTKVWEDIHTAIYYCPGSDSYGKTTNGKYVSQLTAQEDQFEPANRRVCD